MKKNRTAQGQQLARAERPPKRAKSFSLLIGASKTPAGRKKFSKKDERVLRELTKHYFPDGFTILNADGGWYDPKAKTFVTEEARQIIIATADRSVLRKYGEHLCAALDQKEIAVVELGTIVTLSASKK